MPSRITNLADMTCRKEFTTGVAGMLDPRLEPVDRAAALSERTATTLTNLVYDKFYIPSPSGVTYRFLVDRNNGACILALWSKVHGAGRITNQARPFLSTRLLPACQCTPFARH